MSSMMVSGAYFPKNESLHCLCVHCVCVSVDTHFLLCCSTTEAVWKGVGWQGEQH